MSHTSMSVPCSVETKGGETGKRKDKHRWVRKQDNQSITTQSKLKSLRGTVNEAQRDIPPDASRFLWESFYSKFSAADIVKRVGCVQWKRMD